MRRLSRRGAGWNRVRATAFLEREENQAAMKRGFLFGLLFLIGCATTNLIPGTRVPDTKINRELIELCERYRRAMEERDAPSLLALAHPQYYEDSGTPKGDDDYGFDGLREVLAKRLPSIRAMRYSIEYRKISIDGKKALIDIRYDASFQLATEMGDRWERKQNDKRLELLHDGTRWLILAGM
jgi:hypothetical protein